MTLLARTALALLSALCATTFALAQDLDLYPEDALVEVRSRYDERLRDLFERVLFASLNQSEKDALAGVQVLHPLRGRDALNAYAYVDRGIPTVVLPVLTLRMVEDMTVAYAWRHLNNYSLEPIDEYFAMLKYRKAADFPGGRKPDPLTALGVPADILQIDPRVDDLSIRFRNSAWAFILAHELGHLRFRHPGNEETAPETSQANESEVDAFAVDLLGRAEVIPMGAMLWLQATVGYYRNRADFATETAYVDWAREHATHPVNAERMRQMALLLSRQAAGSDGDSADVLYFIAQNLAAMGEILAEPDMQRLIARCAVLGRPEDLTRLEDRPCDERLRN